MANPNVSNFGARAVSKAGTVPAAASAGTRNGSAIDRLGYGSCIVAANVGASSGTPTSFTLDYKLQDSADGSTGWADYTPPSGTAALTQITAASALSSKNIDLAGAKRYLRVVEVLAFVGGSSPTLGCSSVVVLGGAVVKPAV